MDWSLTAFSLIILFCFAIVVFGLFKLSVIWREYSKLNENIKKEKIRRAQMSQMNKTIIFNSNFNFNISEPNLPKETMDKYIEAFRGWRYNIYKNNLDKIELISPLQKSTIWEPGKPLEAKKEFSLSEAGGIYSFKESKDLIFYFGKELVNNGYASYEFEISNIYLDGEVIASGFVMGTVAIWGKVYEHELGYKSEFAYPLALICPTLVVAQNIRRTYGCETTVLETK